MILRDLQYSTKYKVQVRVKLDGIVFNGYWSAWSEPVFIETLPAGNKVQRLGRIPYFNVYLQMFFLIF